VFIGHSLGGLVIKQALVSARPKEGNDNDIALMNSTAALFCFSVPHKGLKNEDMEQMVRGKPNQYLVGDLTEGSALLEMAHRQFLVGELEDCPITSFYETKPTATLHVRMNILTP
jgi:hypothetical protein